MSLLTTSFYRQYHACISTFYALNLLSPLFSDHSVLLDPLYFDHSAALFLLRSTIISLIHSDIITLLCLASFFSNYFHCASTDSDCSPWISSEWYTILSLSMLLLNLLDRLFLTHLFTANLDHISWIGSVFHSWAPSDISQNILPIDNTLHYSFM